jgi:hypothetical protein
MYIEGSAGPHPGHRETVLGASRRSGNGSLDARPVPGDTMRAVARRKALVLAFVAGAAIGLLLGLTVDGCDCGPEQVLRGATLPCACDSLFGVTEPLAAVAIWTAMGALAGTLIGVLIHRARPPRQASADHRAAS